MIFCDYPMTKSRQSYGEFVMILCSAYDFRKSGPRTWSCFECRHCVKKCRPTLYSLLQWNGSSWKQLTSLVHVSSHALLASGNERNRLGNRGEFTHILAGVNLFECLFTQLITEINSNIYSASVTFYCFYLSLLTYLLFLEQFFTEMVLLQLVAGCVLLCLASAEDAHVEGHSRHRYPDPMFDYFACNRKERSYICDPDDVISESEGYLRFCYYKLSCLVQLRHYQKVSGMEGQKLHWN